MLQTRSLYLYFSWSYSPNRLNQSKCSISEFMVTMVTVIIYACYAVQRFKLEVSTLNMNEDIAIWNLLIYMTIGYRTLVGFLLIYKTNFSYQSKSSISVSMVTMITMEIQTCYDVQRFKLEVSTLNMNEDIAIWNLLIYKTIWSSRLVGFLLIYKTIWCLECQTSTSCSPSL